jgi:tRNA A-37 threonylcarbamoyl transferase component Bud32
MCPSEDIFEDESHRLPNPDEAGPLSIKGIKVLPLRSITLGDFQILRKLGAGSMGAVYLAMQRSAAREVALKVLYRHLALQQLSVERFYREAAAMARLSHPGIVRIFGVGQTQGFHHIAMECVQGYNVAHLQANLGGRLEVRDALNITLRVAEALEHAHQARIVHRDVKPKNILVTDLGYVKLTDLGLAKPLDEDLSLTDSGTGVGTPLYMPPEQLLNGKRADHRADIYALGGVLYEFLTARPPFHGDSAMEMLRAKERGLFPPARRFNPAVSEALDLVVHRMLAADLRYRYQSCTDLIRDIRHLGQARDHLSFNVLRVGGALSPVTGASRRLEILLIQGRPEDVLLAQEALLGVAPMNLCAVQAGADLAAYLRRAGAYAGAPKPNLVLLGIDLAPAGAPAVFRALQAHAELRRVPIVFLSPPDKTAEVSGLCTTQTMVRVVQPEDVAGWRRVLEAVHGLADTVVQ